MNEFVLSDESRNSYGFIVVTKGIKLDNFRKNPVMFYNHNRDGGIIGRWENIRIEGLKLIGTPVFDLSDALGAKIAQKVEGGFIRAASIGLEPTERKGDIITACNLIECSVCDIPSNSNALMLYHQGKPVKGRNEYLQLTNLQNNMNNEDFKKILALLGLKDDATIDDVLSVISSMKEEKPETLIENAISKKYIKPFEKEALLKLNAQTLSLYLAERKKETNKELRTECEKAVQAAMNDGRLKYDGTGATLSLWYAAFEQNKEAAKSMLNDLNKPIKPMDLIRQSGTEKKAKSEWTLNDYRKHAPKELVNDSELYERLVREDRERKK